MSIYHFLETVAKLEKRLKDGQEGAVTQRGHTPIQDLRSKMDKFIRVLGNNEIQVGLQETEVCVKHVRLCDCEVCVF